MPAIQHFAGKLPILGVCLGHQSIAQALQTKRDEDITIYGEKPNFKQIYYEYDQKDRVLSTIDSQNRKQLFFYNENGLLNNVYTYNGNGDLEVEFLFKYTYHE